MATLSLRGDVATVTRNNGGKSVWWCNYPGVRTKKPKGANELSLEAKPDREYVKTMINRRLAKMPGKDIIP